MIHTQSLNELWWRMLWNICHSICDEDMMNDVLKNVVKVLSLNLWWRYDEWCVESLWCMMCWKFVMHDVLKVCDAWCVESLWCMMCWKFVESLLKVCSSYIFHNLSEYIEVFWLICYRSSFKNVCHYNCWMKVEWNFVTIIVEWRLNEELRMKLCVCIIKCLSKNVTHMLSWMFMIKNHDALLKCLCWRCDEELFHRLLNEVWNECWNNCCDEVVLKLYWRMYH